MKIHIKTGHRPKHKIQNNKLDYFKCSKASGFRVRKGVSRLYTEMQYTKGEILRLDFIKIKNLFSAN